jgi:hypothetical protein
MDAIGSTHVPLCIGRRTNVTPAKQEAAMRGVAMKTILAAMIAGSSLLVATGASAHDRWDKWERWERKHHWKQSRGYGPPPQVIVERPVYVAPVRPVYVPPMAPMAPMMPMAPAYGYGGYQQDPSVNFNFSFPR